jgi:hypothetical protein
MAACSTIEPALTQLNKNYRVRCLLYEGQPTAEAENVQHG